MRGDPALPAWLAGPVEPVERQRLFRLLDAVPAGAVVWLVAAGGYGKTTLALTYARAASRSVLYLAIPATGLTVGEFFFGLREQARRVYGSDADALPLLNPEYTSAPDTFARHFAGELNRHLNGPAVLLLDDLHHLGEDDPLHRVIAALVEAVDGERLRLIVTSRHEPPPAWARWRGQGRVVPVDERELAFDAEETAALLARHGVDESAGEQADAAELTSTLRGWAAGLMLLLEHWRRTGELSPRTLPQRSLADWFHQEVYAPLPEEERDLLCDCALPPLLPLESVSEVTGVTDAEERLKRLQREHAFMLGHEDDDQGLLYRFHDLFRDFLRHRAASRWSESEMHARCRRWGRRLWEMGRWAEAAPLLIEAGDHDGLAEGIKGAAGVMLQTGRGDKLFGWLLQLPETLSQQDPELRLWQGMCLILHDTVQARALLSGAWEELSERRAYVPMAIAWSGIVDSIWLEWGHVSLYEHWIDEFQRFEQEFRDHLPRPLWLTVLRGMLAAVCYGRPLDPSLERWESEALTALSGEMPDTERVMLAGQLMYLNTWQFGRRAGASRVMAVMDGQKDAIERASPLARCLWQTFTSLWALLFDADRKSCLREADVGRDLIREHGIGTWDDAVPPLHCALCFDDQAALDDWMAWFLRTECKANRPFYDTFQAHFLSGRAWLAGDAHEAIGHARRSLEAAERHGSVVIYSGFRAIYAGLLAEAGEQREALKESARARRIGRGLPSDFLEVMVYMALARIPLHRGQPRRALPYLRRAFAAGERQRMFFPLMVRSRELSVMCSLALGNDIAPEYARWLIAVRGLQPPAEVDLRRHWPWRCRVQVLGCFRLEVDGEAVEDTGRSRRRLRSLLSEIVMAGPAGLSQEALAARLWPDSAPARALNSLHVTVHRLREQFGDTAAVVAQGGQLYLNRERVWVDAWEFQDLAAQPEQLDLDTLRSAFELYGGAPRLDAVDEMDLDIHQASLARIYERVAVTLGERLEPHSANSALAVYRTALGHAALHEGLWAGVLRCEAILGNRQALEQSYRQLQERFHRDLDMEPPAALQRLYRSLSGADGAAGSGSAQSQRRR